MSAGAPLIALVSAVPAAIPPAVAALTEHFPSARVWNILDDRLIDEANSRGGVDEPLETRMQRLIDHAIAEGADGVLLTCSIYGFVANKAAATARIPVFGPDDAAFDAVTSGGYRRVLVLSSVELALQDAVDRLTSALEARGVEAEVIPAFAAGAFEASKSGNTAELVEALTLAAHASASEPDVILFAQYSLAPAAQEVARRTGIPVVTGPARSALALRAAVVGT